MQSPTPEADIGLAAGKFAEGIGQLLAYGVGEIIVLNVPDSSSTPAIASQGPIAQAGATALADALNGAIAGILAANFPQVKLVDLNAINKDILANADRLWIKNTTEACFNVDLFPSFSLDIAPVGMDTTPGDFSDNPAPSFNEGCGRFKAFGYAYWDTVHPTARLHRLAGFGIIKDLFFSE